MIGSKLSRSLTFGRHLRARQVTRRLYLKTAERIDGLIRPSSTEPASGEKISSAPPEPIFSARSGIVEKWDNGRRFSFLNRGYDLPNCFSWSADGLQQLQLMNLHYMEYLEEVSDKDFVELITSWIRENRPYRKGYRYAAWNSYALSIRTVVWMQQLAKRKLQLSRAVSSLISASLSEQLSFLERYLETDIGGNHLVKNAKALLWGSRFFSGKRAKRRALVSRRLLKNIISEQILADGVHFERSPSYHNQVFADLLECKHLLAEREIPELDSVLERMASASKALSHPDGMVCLFNDAGLNMSYQPAALLAVARDLGIEPLPLSAVTSLKDAGYYIAAFPELYVALDCGPIGPDHLPAHAHGDILSFECSVFGKRLIVDQGVFEYLPGKRRDVSRSTKAHNTVSVAGSEQCEFFSSFRCGRRATAELLSLEQNGRLELSGTHNGFSHLPGKPQHFRTFSVKPRSLTIHDRVSAAYPATASLLIAPDWRISSEAGSLSLYHQEHHVRISSQAPIALEEAEWWPDMGVSFPTRRLVIPFSKENTISVELSSG